MPIKQHTLRLEIHKEPYPFNDEQGEEGNWAHLKLDVLDKDTVIYTVFNTRWYPIELLEWFFVNKHKILNDELKLQGNESIAERISNYYQQNTCYTKVDYLLGYRMTHCIGYGLKGKEHLDVYIGKNKMGYELSFKTEDINVKYVVDLPQFFNDLEKQIKDLY